MTKYELTIKDGDGDAVVFEYNPETDVKHMTVRVTDLDGVQSIPVFINLLDSMALKSFMVLVREAILENCGQ